LGQRSSGNTVGLLFHGYLTGKIRVVRIRSRQLAVEPESGLRSMRHLVRDGGVDCSIVPRISEQFHIPRDVSGAEIIAIGIPIFAELSIVRKRLSATGIRIALCR